MSRREFHFEEGLSAKFWAIDLARTQFTATWGRIGSSGKSQTKSFATEAEAKRQHAKLVLEKISKGYKEIMAVGGSEPAPPQAALPETATPSTAPADETAKPDSILTPDPTVELGGRILTMSKEIRAAIWTGCSIEISFNSSLQDLLIEDKITAGQQEQMLKQMMELHNSGMSIERILDTVFPRKKSGTKLTLAKIKRPKGPLVVYTDDQIDAAEKTLGMRFPEGYRDYMKRQGRGALGGYYIRIHSPEDIVAHRQKWQQFVDTYWHWGESTVPPQREVVQGYRLGDTAVGDELVVVTSDPDKILVLPREHDAIFEAGKGLISALEWLLTSGQIHDPISERDFHPIVHAS